MILFMIHQRNMAMFAIKRLAAFRTNSYLGVPAAVHENNRLISTCNTFRKSIAQSWRHEDVFLLAHLPHIDNCHLRKRR